MWGLQATQHSSDLTRGSARSVLTLLTLGVRRVRGAAGDRERWLAFYWHAAGVIGTLREDSDRLPRPSRSGDVLLPGAGIASQLGHRRLGRHRLRGLVFVSWLSSGSPNGSRRAGLIQRIPSNCISTFAWMTRIKPSRSSGRLAPLVRQVSLRRGSGSSSTPPGTHSASSSVATAQAEPSPAHG
jgi:hypothetical protein